MRLSLFIIVLLMSTTPLYAVETRDAGSLEQGKKHFLAADYEKAEIAFKKAVAQNPESAEAYTWLGKSYLQLGTAEESTNPEMLRNAINAFNRALSVDPNSTEAHFCLGITDMVIQNKDETIKECETLMDLEKELAKTLLQRIIPNGPPKDVSGDLKAISVTKFRITGNQIFVPVTLSNKDRTVKAMFLLDTGAFVSIVTPEIAAQLDIDKSKIRPTTSQVIGGGLLPAGHTDIDSIAVGSLTNGNFHVHILKLGGHEVRFDGVLGMNFLRNFSFRIDFKNEVIIWGPL